jgi:predicted PurR-regulated permease PerM
MSRFFGEKLKVGRILGSILAYLVFFIIVFLFLGLVFPPLAIELYALLIKIDLPIPHFAEEIKNFNFSVQEINNIFPRINDSIGVVFQVLNSTFSGVATVLTLFVLSFYLMLEKDQLHLRMYWFTKDAVLVNKVRDYILSIETQLGGWVRGQMLLMLAVGALNFIGLSLLGIPYALPLALLAGLLEIVPNVGPTIAAIPAVFVGYLAGGPIIAGLVALMAIIIQQLENNLLVPKIMSANANVNPLISLILILTGLKVAGVVGALLAIPVYIVLRTTYKTFLQEKVLE